MTPEQITQLVLTILKVATLLGLSIYAIFALILVRQEQLMEGVLSEAFEPVLRSLVLIHFLASLALVGMAFFIL